MLKFHPHIGRLVNLRLLRSRRGSVLILVVLLLVLMAIMGTAYLVTAKNDMVASKLYEHNVQIDMLVEGVENQALGALTDSSYQTVPLSPLILQHYDDWFTTTTANGSAAPALVDHTWMAARYPTLLTEAVGTLPANGIPRFPVPKGVVVSVNGALYLSTIDNNTSAYTTVAAWQNMTPLAIASLPSQPVPTVNALLSTPGSVACWPAISAPLATNAVFEDPRYNATVPLPAGTVAWRPDGVRTCVIPSTINVNGINYPSLIYWSTINARFEMCMAASASGNGIADSFLWRLPIGTVDGITYYAAVRIIDNNSAINVNTANSSSCDFNYLGAGDTNMANAGFVPGIFPSNIGLAELTWSMRSAPGGVPVQVTLNDSTGSYAEVGALNIYRTANNPLFGGIVGSTKNPNPIDDSNNPRMDFQYRNVGDALWMGLGRRISNPGYVVAGTHYQALGWNESAQLAYKFDLINPVATPSILEQCLVRSLYNQNGTPGWGNYPASGGMPFQSSAWDPSGTTTWFNAGYLFGSKPGQNGNLRAFFVARNPTNNCMPVHQFIAGSTIVTPPATPGTTGLTSIQLGNALLYMAGPDLLPNSPTKYSYMTATAVPRVSLNTADVTSLDGAVLGVPSKQPTLWFGFYNAMLDALNPSVNTAPISGGSAAFVISNYYKGGAQFRSPIRDLNGDYNSAVNPNSVYMSGPQMVLLRSLLAAVNAKDMRDSDDDVSCVAANSIPPALPTPYGTPFAATVAGTQVPVNVYAYGIEKQPFITEVYANTEVQPSMNIGIKVTRTNPIYVLDKDGNPPQNPKGYVCVQLFNPYDVPIDMSNWTLGILNRTATALTMAQITNFPGFTTTAAQSAIIKPHQYMLLENTIDGTSATSASANDAKYRPWAVYGQATKLPPPFANTSTYYVPNLSEVMADPAGLSGAMPGGELVLLRQLRANGAGAPTGDPSHVATVANLVNFAPVDSFDFSGLSMAQPTAPGSKATVFTAIHYVRANPGSSPPNGTFPSAQNLQTYWKFVYPGRWSATGIYNVPINAQNPIANFVCRQEGIAVSSWDTSGNKGVTNEVDWWTDLPGTANALGSLNTVGITITAPVTYYGRAYLQQLCLCAPNGPGTGTPAAALASFPYASSYPNAYPAIQLNNMDMGGPAKQTTANASLPFMFPFGGFPRVGDVLQVPYIGSYILLNANTGALLEVNPVTRDAALADDQDSGNANLPGANDPLEQIGRFCPLQAAVQPTGETNPAGAPNGGLPYVSLVSPLAVAPQTYGPGPDTYAWAAHILDYFTTVENPNDDYLPNFDPNAYLQGSWNPLSTPPGATPNQWTPWQNPLAVQPLPVLNSGNGTADAGNEDLATIDGLININTASVQALYAVPWVPVVIGDQRYASLSSMNTANATNLNRAIAEAIVSYRSTYGPFKTLFELNRVLAQPVPVTPDGLFAPQYNPNGLNTFSGVYGNPAVTDYNSLYGNLSPSYPYLSPTAYSQQDGVANDFEARFNTLTRVSNLITTRSDTYTVYILVQGWSGTGTGNPRLVVQRRVALIVDRSKISATNRTPGITQVQTN